MSRFQLSLHFGLTESLGRGNIPRGLFFGCIQQHRHCYSLRAGRQRIVGLWEVCPLHVVIIHRLRCPAAWGSACRKDEDIFGHFRSFARSVNGRIQSGGGGGELSKRNRLQSKYGTSVYIRAQQQSRVSAAPQNSSSTIGQFA